MDEALAVVRRLDRIEALDRGDAEPRVLLDELRALVGEAEAWARAERDDDAIAVVDACRAALARPRAIVGA